MKKILIIFFATISIHSCDKSNDFELSSVKKKKIVLDGFFTDQLEKQGFKIGWSTKLGDTIPDYLDDVKLEITGPGGLISFNYIAEGLYESNLPFAGLPNADYGIKFTHNNQEYSAITTMPAQIEIVSSYLTSSFGNSTEDLLLQPNLHLVMNCNKNQYYRYEVYKALDVTATDTSWNYLDSPIYVVSPVYDSLSQDLVLFRPNTFDQNYFLEAGDILKVKIYSISKDIGLYLLELQDFMTTELNGSQYQNPPFYFSNEAYGLAYGTSVDSTYFYF